MGFTHYWYRPLTFSKKKFDLLFADVQKLAEHLPKHSLSAGEYYKDYPLVLKGPMGTGEPIITDELISFNGDELYVAENGENEDLAHEEFYLPRILTPESWEKPTKERGNQYFQFCKTARKPYDLFVCACLMALKYHFPRVRVSSDGDYKDWEVAIFWYRDVLDRIPLNEGPWLPEKKEEEAVSD